MQFKCNGWPIFTKVGSHELAEVQFFHQWPFQTQVADRLTWNGSGTSVTDSNPSDWLRVLPNTQSAANSLPNTNIKVCREEACSISRTCSLRRSPAALTSINPVYTTKGFMSSRSFNPDADQDKEVNKAINSNQRITTPNLKTQKMKKMNRRPLARNNVPEQSRVNLSRWIDGIAAISQMEKFSFSFARV